MIRVSPACRTWRPEYADHIGAPCWPTVSYTTSWDTIVARRMLAIANALDGMSRVQSARLAGMDRQALRDWVIRHNEAGLEGLHDRRGDGRLLSDRRVAIKAVILQAAAGKYLGFCVWDS